jgi:molecular chaperone DnaJ
MSYSSATLDPYRILGVSREASLQTIKQAYRRVALESHPDRHPGDPDAAERFRLASRAYELLRDPIRRPAYDRTGRWDDTGWGPDAMDVQLADAIEIFAREFGAAVELPATDEWAAAHAGAVPVPVDVTWDEVESGGRRRVPTPCARCAGSGSREGSAQVRCTSCGGSGRLRKVQSSFLGPRIQTEPCQDCRGTGRRPLLPCSVCDGSGRAGDGEPLELLIPRGVGDGDPLFGMASNGSRFVARLVEDQRWARDGADLYAIGRIPYELAVLGGSMEIQLPGRAFRVDVAPGTASGHRARVQGQGLPHRDGDGRGDLVLTLHVAVPDRIGTLERFWLALRRGRRTPRPGPGVARRIRSLRARAAEVARDRWRLWKLQRRQTSLVRIESTAASLRASARFVAESERRLGPLLEQAFPLIAPEAALARRRLERDARARTGSPLGTLVVDSLLAATLAAVLWYGIRFSGPALLAAGDAPLWAVIAAVHPVFAALAPVAIGLAAGALRERGIVPWVQRLAALPIGVALAGITFGVGATSFAVATYLVADADPVTVVALTGALALTLGLVPLILLLLGVSVVRSVRSLIRDAADRRDRRTLRHYDTAAAHLSTEIQGMERAFRELLARADDARHPLTSLLDTAASTLTGERDRVDRGEGRKAVAALAAGILIAAAWTAATALAVAATLAVTLALPAAPAWAGGATIATVFVLCSLGAVLPTPLLERRRLGDTATAIASATAVIAMAGVLLGPVFWTGWLATASVTAALVLSFRLRDAVRATAAALTIAGAGLVAILLWPLATILGMGAGTRR